MKLLLICVNGLLILLEKNWTQNRAGRFFEMKNIFDESRQVSKDEFLEYIEGKNLIISRVKYVEPPLRLYKRGADIVALICRGEVMQGAPGWKKEECVDTYYIIENDLSQVLEKNE